MEAPQINAGLRLVEQVELGCAGDQRRDLNALELAAGQARVDLALDIVHRAQPDFGQIGAGLVCCQSASGRKPQQVAHIQAFKPDRLLEGEADSKPGPLGHAEAGDIRSVKQNLALRRLFNAHNNFCKRRFPAAVGAGDYNEAVVLHREVYIVQNLYARMVRIHSNAKGNVLKLQHGISLRLSG